ncbi:SGNH/GDSL hydrolase family protein [Nocardia sp. NPDC004860]|uniref:SGNH/GDSL hydrolase family protein n=1 Tax=Nocardia sp. NPDC004860 TaxID=3154557 RepID=UPI0033B5B8D4
MPYSVVNAGISGNRVTRDGFIPQFGPVATARLQHDVLDQPGVTDVIILEGINDLGIPIGADYHQLVRRQLNSWIRGQQLADSVIDFDAALHDPADPSVPAPRYTGPDNLHPNATGYQAMADAIDLTIFGGQG